MPKALGFKPGHIPAVVDATAGLGRDSYFLAALGAQVTLIERSDGVFRALQESFSELAAESEEAAAIIARTTLIHGDAIKILPRLAPQVVLVDPMHPERRKSALVKKQMRDLREMVGADEDAAELMQVALASAQSRVVLKWPQKAPPLPDLPKPSHIIPGKTIRYDVFITSTQRVEV